jgi:two-component system, NtrC family, sensor kinase
MERGPFRPGVRQNQPQGLRSTRRAPSVATRVLVALSVVAITFTAVTVWGLVALGSAAEQSRLLQTGYFPLTRSLRDLVTLQDTWNTQLNHVTTARNPVDARVWFDSALRIGRPKQFSALRSVIANTFSRSREPGVRAVGDDVLADVRRIDRTMEADRDQVRQLFEAMESGDDARAERVRDSLVKRGLGVHGRLARLDQRVFGNIESLTDESTREQRFAVWLLLCLAVITVSVGILMAVYTRHVLRPLALVTRRARDVAKGDLQPHSVLDSGDEIGELSTAFESMVGAISEMEGRLVKSERLATIGKMAAHVTHEIRNPLSSMALNLELLEEEITQTDTTTKPLLRAIGVELERLTALTEHYLSIARDTSATLEQEDIVAVVREALVFMRPELQRHGVTLRSELPRTASLVAIDEAQIKQALYNLLRNSCEAISEEGTLWVSLDDRGPEGVRLVVEDDGSGVDPTVKGSLFEPFVTTKSSGTGLGLAITRQIVERHGGTIDCEPREPRGTRFVVTIPRAGEPVGQSAVPQSPPAAHSSRALPSRIG